MKILRSQKKITQSDLAEAVGVSRQTVISIESNRYSPSVVLSLKIAKTMGVAVEDIFELEESDW